MQQFWDRLSFYGRLSDESRQAFEPLLKKKTYKKNEFFVKDGQIVKNVAFVCSGLFSQYHTSDTGDVIIKRFFPENFFVASISALLTKSPSNFAIKALETSTVLEYDFYRFKELTEKYREIASFYIRYIELHWIVEKEPLEISLRYDSAKSRYADFLQKFPTLESRLKQHEVASYIGVTPTQLSRIRAEL